MVIVPVVRPAPTPTEPVVTALNKVLAAEAPPWMAVTPVVADELPIVIPPVVVAVPMVKAPVVKPVATPTAPVVMLLYTAPVLETAEPARVLAVSVVAFTVPNVGVPA